MAWWKVVVRSQFLFIVRFSQKNKYHFCVQTRKNTSKNKNKDAKYQNIFYTFFIIFTVYHLFSHTTYVYLDKVTLHT